MPYRRGRMGSPVKTDKHEVTWSNLSQDASTAQAVVLTDTVAVANKDGNVEVAVGSHVRWIYFEMHFAPESTTTAKVIHWNITYQPDDSATIPSPALYYQDERSFIMKRGMEMLVRDQGAVYKRIFTVKIPKVYQRRKMGDRIILNYICTSSETINACGIAIYKEIY